MAVRVTRELVCDMCGRDDEVTRWKITNTSTNRSVSPDLCEKDSEFLRNLYDKLPHGRRGQTRARPVLTQEEVDALARKPRKTAAKKTTRKRP